MREINDIMKDLTTATEAIQSKKKILDTANEAQSKAFTEHDKAQNDAVGFRDELNQALDLLVPASLRNNKVRQSG